MSTTTRLIAPEDAAVLSELLVANREFLAPWEPLSDDDSCTVEAQRREIEKVLKGHRQDGGIVPHVILADGNVIGRITLSYIVRHNFQSGIVGYWVAEAHNRRGHASEALSRVIRMAFDDLALHRVEAFTLVHNIASQTVLARNGFTKIGLAPKFMQIAGAWQDHILYQRITDRG